MRNFKTVCAMSAGVTCKRGFKKTALFAFEKRVLKKNQRTAQPFKYPSATDLNYDITGTIRRALKYLKKIKVNQPCEEDGSKATGNQSQAECHGKRSTYIKYMKIISKKCNSYRSRKV